MTQSLVPSAGWTVSHWFYRIDRARWLALSEAARAVAIAESASWLAAAHAEEGLQLIALGLVGKGDLGILAVHPDLRRHQQLGQEIQASELGACLVPIHSFLSISEASEYLTSEADWEHVLLDEQKVAPGSPEFTQKMASFRERMKAYAESRLHPQLPSQYSIVCFYPMAKARRDQHNWYTLPFEERKKLMQGHGDAGRRYASRVTQLITTATGIDDWEWGVTLFANDLKAIRDVVYEMRFDKGSAIYGEFGSFYVGVRFTPDELASVLRL